MILFNRNSSYSKMYRKEHFFRGDRIGLDQIEAAYNTNIFFWSIRVLVETRTTTKKNVHNKQHFNRCLRSNGLGRYLNSFYWFYVRYWFLFHTCIFNVRSSFVFSSYFISSHSYESWQIIQWLTNPWLEMWSTSN